MTVAVCQSEFFSGAVTISTETNNSVLADGVLTPNQTGGKYLQIRSKTSPQPPSFVTLGKVLKIPPPLLHIA